MNEVVAQHFEDELWLALAEAHERRRQGIRLTPTVDQRHRRRGRRLVMAGVGATAAAASLAVALTLTKDGTTQQPPTTTRPMVDVSAKVIAAVDEANATMIVHITATIGGTEYHAYTDEVSGSVRVTWADAEGNPVIDSHPKAVPTDQPSDHQAVSVNYCAHQYGDIEAMIDSAPNESLIQQVKDDIGSGALVQQGTEVVDGRKLIRFEGPGITIVGEDPDDPDAPPRKTTQVLWVDPDTFRPVRGEDVDAVREYEFLERTPENLREKMSPPIPAGFTHVDQLPMPSTDCN